MPKIVDHDERRQQHRKATRLHALIDGLSLHALHIPDGIPAARLRAIVAEHLSDLAGSPRRDSH